MDVALPCALADLRALAVDTGHQLARHIDAHRGVHIVRATAAVLTGVLRAVEIIAARRYQAAYSVASGVPLFFLVDEWTGLAVPGGPGVHADLPAVDDFKAEQNRLNADDVIADIRAELDRLGVGDHLDGVPAVDLDVAVPA